MKSFFTIFIEKTIRSNLLTCILLYCPPSISLGIYNVYFPHAFFFSFFTFIFIQNVFVQLLNILIYNHTHARVVTHSSNSRHIWQQVPCVYRSEWCNIRYNVGHHAWCQDILFYKICFFLVPDIHVLCQSCFW